MKLNHYQTLGMVLALSIVSCGKEIKEDSTSSSPNLDYSIIPEDFKSDSSTSELTASTTLANFDKIFTANDDTYSNQKSNFDFVKFNADSSEISPSDLASVGTNLLYVFKAAKELMSIGVDGDCTKAYSLTKEGLGSAVSEDIQALKKVLTKSLTGAKSAWKLETNPFTIGNSSEKFGFTYSSSNNNLNASFSIAGQKKNGGVGTVIYSSTFEGNTKEGTITKEFNPIRMFIVANSQSQELKYSLAFKGKLSDDSDLNITYNIFLLGTITAKGVYKLNIKGIAQDGVTPFPIQAELSLTKTDTNTRTLEFNGKVPNLSGKVEMKFTNSQCKVTSTTF